MDIHEAQQRLRNEGVLIDPSDPRTPREIAVALNIGDTATSTVVVAPIWDWPRSKPQ